MHLEKYAGIITKIYIVCLCNKYRNSFWIWFICVFCLLNMTAPNYLKFGLTREPRCLSIFVFICIFLLLISASNFPTDVSELVATSFGLDFRVCVCLPSHFKFLSPFPKHCHRDTAAHFIGRFPFPLENLSLLFSRLIGVGSGPCMQRRVLWIPHFL